jgi:hypothetical protein
MSGDILSRARKDFRRITECAFNLSIVLKDRNGVEATVPALGSHHTIWFDTDGQFVDANNVHISFIEDALKEASPQYTLRDSRGEINMKGHTVKFSDEKIGLSREWHIKRTWPSNTIGTVVCLVERFEDSQ